MRATGVSELRFRQPHSVCALLDCSATSQAPHAHTKNGRNVTIGIPLPSAHYAHKSTQHTIPTARAVNGVQDCCFLIIRNISHKLRWESNFSCVEYSDIYSVQVRNML